MDLLRAVIADLASFALHSLKVPFAYVDSPRGNRDYSDSFSNNHKVIYAAPRPERLALVAPQEETQVELPHAHLESVFATATIAPQRNTVVYVATSEAPLRNSPEHGVDNVLLRMPYGAMLVAMETTGEWVHIFFRGVEGYVELRDLADKAAHVYPKFIIGDANTAEEPNTERVRAIIGDEFSFGEAVLPLQAEEYVLYKLIRNGIDISWGSFRPRSAGYWAAATVGIPNVERKIEPQPRTAIEWTMHDGKGHIAFVESVTTDGALTISEVNWPEQGIYNERVLVREEWMALAPTFMYFK